MSSNTPEKLEMEPSPKFSLDEKVFCFQGSLLYDGKIVKMEIKDGTLMFLVHYVGWRKSYDEWVPSSKVLEINAKTIKQKEKLEKSMQASKHARSQDAHKSTEKKSPAAAKLPVKQKSLATASVSTLVVNSDSQKTENHLQRTTEATTETTNGSGSSQIKTRACEKNELKGDIRGFRVHITMPYSLKNWLIDDYDLINNKKRLVHLPTRISVDDVIKKYRTRRFSEDGMAINEQTCIEEICKGIQLYFNMTLSLKLLYSVEKPQYKDIVTKNPEKSASQLYGPSHLVRLFAKMNGFLATTVYDEEGASLVTKNLDAFQQFLSESLGSLFDIHDYEDA